MKAIKIQSCNQCPFYKEIRKIRDRSITEISICKVQDNKEIEYSDAMDIPNVYNKVHESCKLDDYFE